ncbi:MAG: hypothetical protein HXY34_02170 [Candidatus Thorarchaeota archaeon]|nr:hypothetical protein [Candidatus Thorarchaeota archaeon]
MGEKKDEPRGLRPSVAGAVMLIVVYLAPWWFVADRFTITIGAVGWALISSSAGSSLTIPTILELIPTLPVQGLYLLIPIMAMRYYEGKTTLKKALLVGALAYAPILFIILMTFLPSLWDPYWPYRQLIGVPVPLSLLALYLLARLKPSPVDSSGDWLQSRSVANTEAESGILGESAVAASDESS